MDFQIEPSKFKHPTIQESYNTPIEVILQAIPHRPRSIAISNFFKLRFRFSQIMMPWLLVKSGVFFLFVCWFFVCRKNILEASFFGNCPGRVKQQAKNLRITNASAFESMILDQTQPKPPTPMTRLGTSERLGKTERYKDCNSNGHWKDKTDTLPETNNQITWNTGLGRWSFPFDLSAY